MASPGTSDMASGDPAGPDRPGWPVRAVAALSAASALAALFLSLWVLDVRITGPLDPDVASVVAEWMAAVSALLLIVVTLYMLRRQMSQVNSQIHLLRRELTMQEEAALAAQARCVGAWIEARPLGDDTVTLEENEVQLLLDWRTQRERSQAPGDTEAQTEAVRRLAEMTRRYGADGPAGAHLVTVAVHNGSVLPVYDIDVEIVSEASPLPGTAASAPVVRPNATTALTVRSGDGRVLVAPAVAGELAGAGALRLSFTDSAGVRWARGTDGVLTRRA